MAAAIWAPPGNASAATSAHTVVPRDYYVSRIGPFRPAQNPGGRLPGQTTCTPSVGRAQGFVARGSRFRTTKGLRVGDPSSSIPIKHPDAELQPQGFWALALAEFPFGDSEEPAPVLNALVMGGRVIALAGYSGGAGE